MNYYVDESGDPVYFNKKGKDLIKSGKVSKVFIVGYLETGDPNRITKRLRKIRNDIKNDVYLKGIPSVKKSLIHFHAKDDCVEVREKVFKAIYEMDIKVFVVVARKDPGQFRKKFNCKPSKMYEYLVEKLFENRLHLYSEIDIYFSKMGNVVRETNMKTAINQAKTIFENKWSSKNKTKIRVFVQEPSQIMPLQVVDYLLWAVNRVYERKDMRHYNYIKDKIILIQDIFDVKKYPKTYYTPKNPLDIKKMSPIDS